MATIGPNSTRNFNGDTVVGNIGEGASITVTDGSLTVTGTVGDNATIIVKAKEISLNNNNFSFGNFSNGNIFSNTSFMNFSGSGTVFINGVKINGNHITTTSDKKLEIIFEKRVGNNVSIKAEGNITFLDDVGEYTKIEAERYAIKGKNFGLGTGIFADRGTIEGFKVQGPISADRGTIHLDEITNQSNVSVERGRLTVRLLGAHCKVSADRGTVNVSLKDRTATIQAKRGSVLVREEFDSARQHQAQPIRQAKPVQPVQAQPVQQPQKPEPAKYKYNKQVDEYLKFFDESIPFSIQCEEAGIEDDDIPNKYIDPIHLGIMNVPVSVQGHSMDLCNIDDLLKNAPNGQMVNPITNSRNPDDLFTVVQIQPNRELKGKIEKFIKKELEKKISPNNNNNNNNYKPEPDILGLDNAPVLFAYHEEVKTDAAESSQKRKIESVDDAEEQVQTKKFKQV